MNEIPHDEQRLRRELALLIRAGLLAHLTAPLADLLTAIDLKGLKLAKAQGGVERGRWRRNPLAEHYREAEMRYWRTTGDSRAYSFEFRAATIIYSIDTIARDLRAAYMNRSIVHRAPTPLFPVELRTRVAGLVEENNSDEFIAVIDMLAALSAAWQVYFRDTPNTQYFDPLEFRGVDL